MKMIQNLVVHFALCLGMKSPVLLFQQQQLAFPPLKFPIFGDAVTQEFHLPGTEVVQVLRVMFFHSWGAVFVHRALFSKVRLPHLCLG